MHVDKTRVAGETIDAAEDCRNLRKIAPIGANGYVKYKNGLIEFYYVPENILGEFITRYLEKQS